MQLIQDSYFSKKNELPQVGLEPAMFCIPGRCFTCIPVYVISIFLQW